MINLFLAVVSSPLPSSHVVYQVFFLNSATKKLILFGCHPWTVSPGAARPSAPSNATADSLISRSNATNMLSLPASGVTKVGVTRWTTDSVTLFLKKTNDFFSDRHLKSDNLFSNHLVTASTRLSEPSNVVCPVLSVNSAAKNNFIWVSTHPPPCLVSPGAERPTPVTLLLPGLTLHIFTPSYINFCPTVFFASTDTEN